MEESLITDKTANLALESGFDIHQRIIHSYKGGTEEMDLRGTSQSILQKWLREIHKIDVIPYPSFMGKAGNYYYVIIKDRDFDNIIQQPTLNMSYEDCLEAGLQEALRLID